MIRKNDRLLTNAGQLISFEFETEDRYGGALYISVVEHYDIIDPNLPYADRFRTNGYTLDISSEDGTIDDEFEITVADMLDMAVRLIMMAKKTT